MTFPMRLGVGESVVVVELQGPPRYVPGSQPAASPGSKFIYYRAGRHCALALAGSQLLRPATICQSFHLNSTLSLFQSLSHVPEGHIQVTNDLTTASSALHDRNWNAIMTRLSVYGIALAVFIAGMFFSASSSTQNRPVMTRGSYLLAPSQLSPLPQP